MSRVFVVEPHKMLQQAFVVALFPEHEVQASEKFPAPSTETDVVIIDAAALRERGLLTAREMGEIQAWKFPLVWIDDGRVSESGTIPDATLLRLPLSREALRAAVAQSLGTPAAPRPSGAPEIGLQGASGDGKAEPHQPKPASAKEVIELVDVFEETPDRVDTKTRNKR